MFGQGYVSVKMCNALSKEIQVSSGGQKSISVYYDAGMPRLRVLRPVGVCPCELRISVRYATGQSKD